MKRKKEKTAVVSIYKKLVISYVVFAFLIVFIAMICLIVVILYFNV